MKEKILEWLKKPVVILGSLLALALVAIKFLFSIHHDDEVKVEQAEAEKTDATLAQQQADLSAEHKQAIEQLEKDKGRSLTQDEMTDFLNKL